MHEMTIQELYGLYLAEGGIVSTDSRKAAGLFFALKGEKFDANMFATSALESGAAYAVVDNPSVVSSDRYILVSDVLKTLQNLARYHRRALALPVIAVTGTNGKTTTKELMRDVLSKKFYVKATQGNLNNHIGVPLTILGLDSSVQIAVIEMGANHPGEIAASCQIAEPDFGLITNVGIAHLEGFGSVEGIRKTKGELYDFLASNGGMAFYNSSDAILSSMVMERSSLKTIPYTMDAVAVQNPSGLLSFALGAIFYQTSFVGEVNLKNISAAMAVGSYFKVPREDMLDAITSYVPSNNRSQIVQTPSGNMVILDAYNANPSSMSLALDNLVSVKSDKKVIIMGQMNELGPRSRELHAEILSKARSITSSIYLVGEQFAAIAPENTFDSFEALSDYLRSNPLSNSTILVKGSRTNALERLIPIL